MVLNRRHIIFTMSENFAIKIDSLQHLEIFKKNLACEPAKNLRYNIHCFDVMLIFPCRLFSGICIECVTKGLSTARTF